MVRIPLASKSAEGRSGAASLENLINVYPHPNPSIHAQLRKEGLANFGDGASTAEIPDWAQEPLVKHVAGKCAALFGHRDQGSIVIFEGARQGYIDLQIQHHGGKKHIRTRTKGY